MGHYKLDINFDHYEGSYVTFAASTNILDI